MLDYRRWLRVVLVGLIVNCTALAAVAQQKPWPDAPDLLTYDRAYYSGPPQVRLGGDGLYHVLWLESAPTYDALLYSHGLAAPAGWTPPEKVFSVNQGQELWSAPGVAVDSTGTLHTVLLHSAADGSRHLQYLTRSSSGSWSASQAIYALHTTNPALADLFSPRLALDNLNRLHLVWLDDDAAGNVRVYYGRQEANGAWSAATDLTTGLSQPLQLYWPDITYTANDDMINVVFAGQSAGGGHDLWFTARSIGSLSWPTPIDITPVSTSWHDAVGPVSLTADTTGKLYIVGVDTTPGHMAVRAKYRAAGGTSWTGAEMVALAGEDGVIETRPAVAVDKQGVIHVAYDCERTLVNYDVFYARKEGNTWVERQRNLSRNPAIPPTIWNSFAPDVATNAEPEAEVVWYTHKMDTGVTDVYAMGSDYVQAPASYPLFLPLIIKD